MRAGEDTVRLPVAVLAVLATVVAALLVVALVVRLDADRLPSGPPHDPPALAPASSRMMVDGREVTFQELKVTLPGAPFRCEPDLPSLPTGFTQLAACQSTVHENYDGKGHGWAAVTGVALVDDAIVRPGDLTTTTSSVFDAVMAFSFSPTDRPTLKKEAQGPATIPAPVGSAYSRQADVHVRLNGLPTPYDRLVVVVVALQSGRHVAFFSDFPHDGSKEALRAVVASVSSLSAQR